MSENASLDFNPESAVRYSEKPRDFEFQVLSRSDIQGFVNACQLEVTAQWSEMEERMEHGVECNRAQLNFVHQEFQAENSQIINFF